MDEAFTALLVAIEYVRETAWRGDRARWDFPGVVRRRETSSLADISGPISARREMRTQPLANIRRMIRALDALEVSMTTNTDNHKFFLILAIVGALLCLAALVAADCLWLADECDLVRPDRPFSPFTKGVQGLLGFTLFFVSVGLAWCVAWEIKVKKSFADMIHAILSVSIYFCVVSAWTIALWPWLAGDAGSNVDTIVKIALASAALPTVLFVIWRERIASDASLDQRFNNAINRLGNPTESVRIASVYLLRLFRPYADYRIAALAALRSHLATAVISQSEFAAINEAIRRLQT